MRALLALTLMCSAALAQAAVVTREIPYQDEEGKRFVGYYAYDDALDDKRPGIVVQAPPFMHHDNAGALALDGVVVGVIADQAVAIGVLVRDFTGLYRRLG